MCPTQTEIILLWFVVKDGVVMDRNERFDVIEVGKRLRFENQTSRSPKNKPLEVGKRESNNTKINKTEFNKTNLILSADSDDGLDEYTAYAEIIKENLEWIFLLQQYPYDHELLEGIFTSRYPMVCNAMRQCMKDGDQVIYETQSGYSSTLEIRYFCMK